MSVQCQRCANAMATNHVTVITGAVFSELHFCDPCHSKTEVVLNVAAKCDRCGLGFPEIQARGRLGCAKDYEVFSKDLAACIQGYHGASQHVGKMPKTSRRVF